MEGINQEEVIKKLHASWALENRGTGWLLVAPRSGRIRQDSVPVSDSVIERMDHAGILRFELPYNTARAFLV